MDTETYDVIVVGAGPAGAVAAIQAAREGAKTLLIEKSSMPGGSTTLAGVDFPGLFHAWGKQVIAGIGWELVSQAVEDAKGTMPDFTDYKIPHWKLQVKVNPYIYACVLDDAFSRSGVNVLYHTMPVEVREDKDGVSITCACKEGLKHYRCACAVDASGDADLIAKAGYEIEFSPEKQPATLMFHLGGYNLEDIDLEAVEAAYKAEIEAGRMSYLDTGMGRSMQNLLRNGGENCIHLNADSASSSAEKTAVEMSGRATLLRIIRFLKPFKGLEHLHVKDMAPQCGIRETARIVGESIITVENYITGKRHDDDLCYTFYQIDLHNKSKGHGLSAQKLEEGTVPTIPRSALIPRGSKRLIAAGRCLSSDRLANSGLRVQASCMAMGQAAGAMAVLSARRNCEINTLDIAEVKSMLKKHAAIVP